LSAVEAVFALDFDAACFRIGLDADEQARAAQDTRGHNRSHDGRLTVTRRRTMGQ
jgi:hypothetical protein